MVEAQPIYEDILVVVQRGWKRVIVETDLKVVFKALTDKIGEGPWQIFPVVKEACKKGALFVSLHISLVRRSAN